MNVSIGLLRLLNFYEAKIHVIPKSLLRILSLSKPFPPLILGHIF